MVLKLCNLGIILMDRIATCHNCDHGIQCGVWCNCHHVYSSYMRVNKIQMNVGNKQQRLYKLIVMKHTYSHLVLCLFCVIEFDIAFTLKATCRDTVEFIGEAPMTTRIYSLVVR